jgi:metal-dependent HD superfamily phosphatase/phosphodiesterase
MYCRSPGDLPEGVRVPIVRVRYADNLPEADARLRAAFERVHAFVEPYPSDQKVVEVGRDDSTDAAVHTALARLAPVGTVVHRDLSELLEAPNSGVALNSIRERFYKEFTGET